jgi:hypothetical protein
MAQSPNPNRGFDRPEDDDLTSGRREEDVAGRADEGDEDEFEDMEDMEDEEEDHSSR